jgi:4-amino-4-deoxy-L-arabinose transferase-like glycosyltransferase
VIVSLRRVQSACDAPPIDLLYAAPLENHRVERLQELPSAAESSLTRREFRLATALTLAVTALRLWAAAYADLNPDEAYYWYWSRHLAASYFDHPPMVAYLIRLSTDLFGNAPLGVRFLSILLIVPISAATYATGRVLFDHTVGARGLLWLNATVLVGVGGLIATPDMPSVLFWILSTLALAIATRSGNGPWWFLAGCCAGLGVLSKLTDLFLAPGILLCLLSVREQRRWLRTPWPWLGVAVAALLLVPMIRWNAAHEWITFTKQLGRAEPSAFYPKGLPEYIAGQYLLLNPGVATFAGIGFVLWLRRRLSDARPGLDMLVPTVLPLLLYFAVHALFARVEGNWLAPVYPTLALIAAVAAESAAPSVGLKWIRAATVPVGFAIAALGLLAVADPYQLIPPRSDPVKVMHGWARFAADAESIRRASGARWIAAANYSIDAVLVYHLRDAGIPIFDVTEPARYAFAPPPDPALRGEPALLVSDKPFDGSLHRCFAKLAPAPSLAEDGSGRQHQAYGYLAEEPIRGLFRRAC